jgi:DNA-binding MarR family transcriptional regulator
MPRILAYVVAKRVKHAKMRLMNESSKVEVERLRNFVTYRIARVQQKLNAQAAHILRSKAGISLVEWRLLRLLAAHPESSITEISEQFDIDKGQASRKIKAMIADGLVAARVDPEDHRHQILTLTPKGVALDADLLPLMEGRQDFLVANVSKEEMAIFDTVLARIGDAATRPYI